MLNGRACARKSASVRRSFSLLLSAFDATMIYSMTGYAVAARELEHAVLNLELRSVNHRYLDI